MTRPGFCDRVEVETKASNTSAAVGLVLGVEWPAMRSFPPIGLKPPLGGYLPASAG
jgi:hypothetical protein